MRRRQVAQSVSHVMLDHMSSTGVMHGDSRRHGEEGVIHEEKKRNIAAVHARYGNTPPCNNGRKAEVAEEVVEEVEAVAEVEEVEAAEEAEEVEAAEEAEEEEVHLVDSLLPHLQLQHLAHPTTEED